MTPTGIDLELVQTVAEDLLYLQRRWEPDVPEDVLRRDASTLRRLLVNGDYGKAWRKLGLAGEPTVESVDLAASLRGQNRDKIEFAQAGGGLSHGMKVATPTFHRRALSAQEIAARAKQYREPPRHSAGVQAYLKSLSIVVRGTTVSRGDIIKYVANKLGGGVHFDPKRDATKEQAFLALDRIIAVLSVAQRKAPYYELLSIGHDLAQSEDAQTFLDRARDSGVSA